MKVYKVFDVENDEYLNNEWLDFKGIQDLLISECQNYMYPFFEAYEQVTDTIRLAHGPNELESVIDLLDYKIEIEVIE